MSDVFGFSDPKPPFKIANGDIVRIKENWVKVQVKHEIWNKYFNYYESHSGKATYYHREPKEGYEFLKGCHSIEEVMSKIKEHEMAV